MLAVTVTVIERDSVGRIVNGPCVTVLVDHRPAVLDGNAQRPEAEAKVYPSRRCSNTKAQGGIVVDERTGTVRIAQVQT